MIRMGSTWEESAGRRIGVVCRYSVGFEDSHEITLRHDSPAMPAGAGVYSYMSPEELTEGWRCVEEGTGVEVWRG